MKKIIGKFLFIILFFLLTFFTFREYFLKNLVPFPGNLLVSYYEPWRSYSWEGYPNGPPNKPIGFDNLRIFYPLRNLTISQIKMQELPIWNPYAFSGNTLLAAYHPAIFHPLSFLFLILPQIDAWTMIIIIQPLLAFLFTYLFLKELKLSKTAVVFGALTFSFSGFMVAIWEESFMTVYSALFLPLILYGFKKMSVKTTIVNYLISTIAIVFSLLSGWFQMTFYAWIFSFFWGVYLFFSTGKNFRFLFYFLSCFIISILISGVHIIPCIEAYLLSARGTTDAKFLFEIYLQPFWHLITFLAPDYFGNPGTYNYIGGQGFFYEKIIFLGIPAVFLGIYAIFSQKKVFIQENFFKWAFIITISLGFYLPTSWFLLYQLNLPLVSKIIPTRIFFLSSFCLSVLSALGIEKYLTSKEKKIIKIIMVVFLIIFIVILAYAFYIYYYLNSSLIPLKNTILPLFVFGAINLLLYLGWRFKIKKETIAWSLILVSSFSLWYFANKYLYFSEKRFVFPSVPVISQLQKIAGHDRIWGIGKAYLERNFATYYKLYSPEGYDSIYISRYGELIHAAGNQGKYTEDIPRVDAQLPNYIEIEKNFENNYLKRLLSLLGVKYLLAKQTEDGNIKENEFIKPIWNDNKFLILEYKKALPRVFLVGQYVVEKNQQKILDLIFDENFNFRSKLILEEKPKGFTQNNEIIGKINKTRFTPNKIIINLTTEKSSLLFLSDNYYPGWKAYINDQETKIYRTNYAFRSIIVPKGEHKITFQYEPASFIYGIVATLIGLLLFLIIGIIIKYKEKKE